MKIVGQFIIGFIVTNVLVISFIGLALGVIKFAEVLGRYVGDWTQPIMTCLFLGVLGGMFYVGTKIK
jgi:hypothetical protein